MSQFKVGQKVQTTTHPEAFIRYIGPIHVAEGLWFGIELPEPDGKNDGSVRGERYFQCPAGHGLFVKETGIVRIVAQPAPKAAPKVAPPRAASAAKRVSSPIKPPVTKPKTAAPPARPRPSSVVAPKPTARPSIINKRQSLASTSSTATAPRAPVRKASISTVSSASALESSRSTGAASSSRTSLGASSNIDTLQTKIKHLEKQHAEDQERAKELAKTKEERDRFQAIIDKLQGKCQKFHTDNVELKAEIQKLASEIHQASKIHEETQVQLEGAVVDREMAEYRAETAESEVEILRKKDEEAQLEIEVLREESQMYSATMTEEERREAGWYQLTQENERAREALYRLREMSTEEKQELQSRIKELEEDNEQLEQIQQENTTLKEEAAKANEIIEHLQGQLDANVELEEINDQLTTKNQELEDQIVEKDIIIRDLEALKLLNNDLEMQYQEHQEEMDAELEARDIEVTQQAQIIEQQNVAITDKDDMITKFRDVIFDLQSKANNAESMRTMTEAQAKDAASRFNEVMDLNRRLRASNVQATTKEITSELRRLDAQTSSEKLSILRQTQSTDFVNSEAVQAYFATQAIAAKATLVSTLLVTTDRQLSYNDGAEESLGRLFCAQATHHLDIIRIGSERLCSGMAVSSLETFATFGPSFQELITVEKTLDQGLEALKADEVQFSELAGSFGRAIKIQDAIATHHQLLWTACPQEEIWAQTQRISSSVRCLDSNFSVIVTMLKVFITSSEDLSDAVEEILYNIERSATFCNKLHIQSQKLVKKLEELRAAGLYPVFSEGDQVTLDEFERVLSKAARDGTEVGQKAIKVATSLYEQENSGGKVTDDLSNILIFFWTNELAAMGHFSEQFEAWIEHCSVLKNTTESETWPGPWVEKAQEVEDARKKREEATLQLEQLKAEHKATQLTLLERNKVIENKALEIEHLDAKYRDATLKASEAQRLNAKFTESQEKMAESLQQAADLRKQIAFLEEQLAQAGQVEPGHNAPEAFIPSANYIPEEPSSAEERDGLKYLVSALQDENFWLRKQKHADMYDRTMRVISTQFEKEEMPPHLAAHIEKKETEELKETPLDLPPIQVGWYPRCDSPWEMYWQMEKHVELSIDESMLRIAEKYFDDDEFAEVTI